MYSMKKGGSSKTKKQQAAIAMSMKAAGKKPKMQMGGAPISQPIKNQVPVRKGAASAPILGIKKAIYNQAKSDMGETPQTQWSWDQMENWRKSTNKAPYKKGGSVKMKMGGSAKGKTPITPAQKKFASLAAPKDKITFADKIAGAKGASPKMKRGGMVKGKKC